MRDASVYIIRMQDWTRALALVLVVGLVVACQTAATQPAPTKSTTVFSGYFVWDSERAFGAMAVQCINLVIEREEVLEDGQLRMTGISRYVTGTEREINFVDAELIFDPETRKFRMWERNATSDSFVADGKFVGTFQPDMLFLKGSWESDSDGESGQLFLQKGADAPCNIASDA